MMHTKERVESAASANVAGAFEAEADSLMAAFDTLPEEVLKDI
ncbi:hypothetical protein [Methanoculleus frigidifontis]|nr:hypothetical protein [Methanoculleus sp. FWC-SCC1]